jgi:predicted transcriptional regulator
MKTDMKITIKNEECKALSDSYELHDIELYAAIEKSADEYLKKLLEEFHGEPEDVIIRTTTVLK